jgi:P27 family predicted phage terminase small subunit
MTKKGVPLAPSDLGREGKKLWYAAHEEFDLGPDSLEVLRVACYSLERYLQAKRILDKEGITFQTDGGQVKKHPASEIEKAARVGFLQAIRLLGFDYEDGGLKRGPGRPPEQGQESLW